MSKSNELDDIAKLRSDLDSWIDKEENEVAKMLQRPAKFRQDAAQLEINFISDIRQNVAEKQTTLNDLVFRQRSIGGTENSDDSRDLKIKLDTLDEHVRTLAAVVISITKY